jgi:O-antigen/teichoic acid export membrane protein
MTFSVALEPVTAASSQDDFGFKLLLFLGGLLLLLVLLILAARWWSRTDRGAEAGQEGLVRRILKNSLTPIVTNLINKGIGDFAFAIVMLHYLGVEGNGRYALAALVAGQYLPTITDFGLGLLTTREVARDSALANRYLSNTTLIRWALSVLSLPVVAAVIALYGLTPDPLHPQTQTALWLLSATLFPASLAAGVSSLFNAHERMEIPAFAGLLTNVLKIMVGVGVLVAGWGVVGLASSALLVTTINAVLFLYLQRRFLFPPRFELDLKLCRWMIPESLPLLLNNLLLLVFFRFDTFILRIHGGDAAVGSYDAAYRFVNATTLIPAYFALALLPLLSRYAVDARERFERAYHLGMKTLLLVAFPIAMVTTILSRELIYIVGGSDFLPDSAIALSILIWYLPLSYANGVTQYALIAVNRQRTITLSFLIAAAFNIGANLIWIPRHGYLAASIITIVTEVILLIPFWVIIHRHIGRMPLLQLAWRPAVAAIVMGAPMFWIHTRGFWWLALLVAPPLYVGTLLILRTFAAEERELFQRLWPFRKEPDAPKE